MVTSVVLISVCCAAGVAQCLSDGFHRAGPQVGLEDWSVCKCLQVEPHTYIVHSDACVFPTAD